MRRYRGQILGLPAPQVQKDASFEMACPGVWSARICDSLAVGCSGLIIEAIASRSDAHQEWVSVMAQAKVFLACFSNEASGLLIVLTG